MRLIDADAFIKMMEEKCDPESTLDPWVLSVCRGGVKMMPTVDAVPVVRCAVCTHFQCNMRGDGTLPKGVDEFECRNGRGGCDPMGFCDEGERKGGDGNG